MGIDEVSLQLFRIAENRIRGAAPVANPLLAMGCRFVLEPLSSGRKEVIAGDVVLERADIGLQIGKDLLPTDGA